MRSERVALVVEDDPLLQGAIAAYLRGLSFRVVTALHYRAAVRALEREQPDVICVDLGLPAESGYELCEHIRRLAPLMTVPIVLTSERSFPEDMARAEEAGANAFLKKPFSMAQLGQCIDDVLSRDKAKSLPWARRLRWS
jgi:DNA-binding response OmpR family regulator